ncbi:hypothetical protein DFH08DRAFT_798044 [Mycena albidolilacea]|uniref:Uncharacterized protein n=1 Tax=Mycena albidolilacea TaxID=1033008 RepID=A0AAD7ASL9_9AGAR|nr:hypothetical protein DFH08DRAFT_798044 [Mycena albidolilacea]
MPVHPWVKIIKIIISPQLYVCVFWACAAQALRTSTDTSTVWGPGTVSGRALLALGKATIRGIDAILIQRRLATIRLHSPSLTGSMCTDLLELCREVAQPPGWKSERLYDLMVTIIEVQKLEGWESFVAKAAILLDKTCPPTRPSLIRIMFRPHLPQTLTNALVHIILGEIWGSDDDWIRCALIITKLTKNEVQALLRTLLNHELISTCTFTAAKHLCDFLVIIFQITGEYIPRDIAQAIKGLTIEPVYIIVSQIIEETEVTPLSKLQVHGRRGRANTWMVLQTYGLRLETQISQIECILSETLKVSNHQIFDAVADTSIFMRCSFQLKYLVTSFKWFHSSEYFGHELRSLAFDCLFRYCVTPILGQLYEPLRYYTAFYHKLERRVVMGEQLPMNDLDRITTLLRILYNPPSSQKIVWPRQHKIFCGSLNPVHKFLDNA